MDNTFMKKKPVLPLLLSMALPMVISMLVNSLYNIVDSLFVAKISDSAMTALSLVFPVQNFINAAGIGFGVGINAVIAFYSGAGDKERADRAATLGVLLAAIHGVILTVVSILIMPPFLGAFTNDQEVIQFGLQYSNVAFLFSVVINLGMAFEKIFQAVGSMKTSMVSLLCGCIVNFRSPQRSNASKHSSERETAAAVKKAAKREFILHRRPPVRTKQSSFRHEPQTHSPQNRLAQYTASR